jgi:hypothetical protein
MPTDFVTLPDELQALANNILQKLARHGYRVQSEPELLELPATPTILAIRGHETHYFLVRQTVEIMEIQQWHRYCCSCTTDTRATVCYPTGRRMRTREIASLRDRGIGLATIIDDQLQFQSEARDLAFHARAPDRDFMKPKVRQLLGEALDRLDRGDWRPAFEEACGILEEECRSYLIKKLRMAPLRYQSGNKIKTSNAEQIRRMPMGALKDIFCKLVSQNQLEAHLCSALTKLNPDRIRRTHKRKSKVSEAALRRRAGTHFWLINNALSLLV